MAFNAGRVTASLHLDRSPFTRSLAAARKSAANFARQIYQASLGVRGSAGAIGELKAVNAEADRVDGRNVELDVDKDGQGAAHLQSLSGGFKSLASNIRATGTVLAASTIPFAIAGIGAATPSILALGASLAGLALNLGKAAAGFGLVAGAAGGGALAGLKAYTSLITSTVSATRAAWEEQNKKTTEEVKAIRSQILLTHAANDFNEEINQQIIGLSHLQAAVGSAVFPAFTREMRAWSPIIKEFTPLISSTAGAVARAATGFTRWFRTAEDGRVLSEVVGFLSESAVRGARALSQLGQIGISAFRPLIPLATDLQGSVLGILSATNRWVQSAEGQRKLGQIYRSLWEDAKRLAPVVMDLWRGTVQLFNALDRTGIADQASRGFASLASAYERATRAGGGLDRFLRGALRLMPFVGRATMDVVRAIGNIAQAAIGAREQGSRLTILQSIFRGIGAAARPLQRLLVGTFRDLGPEIAKLIPLGARFFSVFAGSSGPLVSFVRVIRRALEIFNGLPGPIKRTVVNLAALKLILGGLGITALVRPLGRFASNMLLARGAAAKLAGGSALGAIVRVAGPVGVAIAAVAAAGYLLYRNWNRIKGVLRPVVDAFKGFVNQLRPAVKALLPTLNRSLRSFASGLLSAIVPGRNLSKQVKVLVNRFAEFVRDTAPKVVAAIRDINRWLKNNQGTVRAVGRVVGQVLVAAFKVFRLNLKIAVGVIKIAVTQFRILAGIGMTAGRAVAGAAKVIVGAFRGIRNRIMGAFDGIPDSFKNLGKFAAQGFIKGFTNNLPGSALVTPVEKAIDAVRHFGHEGSPWGLTEDMGRNAAQGFVKGFRDNLGGVVDAMRRTFDSARQLGPGDPGYLDDGFRKNSRQSPHRGDYGYVQMEDGSWGYNPALYRKQQQMGRTHRYLRNGGGSGFRWNGSEYVPVSPRMGGTSRHEAGRMTDEWMRTLRYLRAHPNNYDIGGDVDIRDTPRKILQFLKRDGWFRRGGSLYHPDTPKRYLPGGGGMPRHMGGKRPLNEDGMRRVMREHRQESQRGGDAIDYDRLGRTIAHYMREEIPGVVDRTAGAYFHHRNAAGADPR